jgi:hypothetical protein
VSVCHDHIPGGPPAKLAIADDQMVFVPTGQLKPQQRLPTDPPPPPPPPPLSPLPPGICIDGSTGDIHLYKNLIDAVQISLTFADASLRWPLDPNVAFQIAPVPSPAHGPWPFAGTKPPTVSGDQRTLVITLPAKGQGHNYNYLLQYLDSQNALHQAEPMVVNH